MSLQEELDKLRKDNTALKEEMATPENSAASISQQLSALVPEAIQQVSHLIVHAESESVRLNASKYVLEIARDGASNEDAIANLLKELAPANP